jgi:hypothetical protein
VTGTILDVKSGGIIDGTINAGCDIGDVTYDYWQLPYWHGIRAGSDIKASISAGGHLFLVEAGVALYGGTYPGGDITGDISAGGDMDFITTGGRGNSLSRSASATDLGQLRGAG